MILTGIHTWIHYSKDWMPIHYEYWILFHYFLMLLCLKSRREVSLWWFLLLSEELCGNSLIDRYNILQLLTRDYPENIVWLLNFDLIWNNLYPRILTSNRTGPFQKPTAYQLFDNIWKFIVIAQVPHKEEVCATEPLEKWKYWPIAMKYKTRAKQSILFHSVLSFLIQILVVTLGWIEIGDLRRKL